MDRTIYDTGGVGRGRGKIVPRSGSDVGECGMNVWAKGHISLANEGCRAGAEFGAAGDFRDKYLPMPSQACPGTKHDYRTAHKMYPTYAFTMYHTLYFTRTRCTHCMAVLSHYNLPSHTHIHYTHIHITHNRPLLLHYALYHSLHITAIHLSYLSLTAYHCYCINARYTTCGALNYALCASIRTQVKVALYRCLAIYGSPRLLAISIIYFH